MNLDLSKVIQWLSTLNEMSAITMTYFLCLAVAVAVRLMPFIKNQWIPAITVLSGPAVLLSITDFKASAIMSVRVFIFRTAIEGFIIGTTSWLCYHYFIRPLKKKFLGANGNGIDNGYDSAPSALTNEQLKQKQTNETKNPPTAPTVGA
jgi:hypothetical protein